MRNRGIVYARKRDDERAIRDYSEAARLDPDDPHALIGRAFLYLREARVRARGSRFRRRAEHLPDVSARRQRPSGGLHRERMSLSADQAAVETLLAVNGTLMRGLELNGNLRAAGATFVREARTAPVYRLWSIGHRHPAMIRIPAGGAAIAVAIWSVPAGGLTSILQQKPPGLGIGKVQLDDGSEELGVLGESILCEGQREISRCADGRLDTGARDGPS